MELSTAQEHFLAMLGSCWENARLGRLEMRLELDDGDVVTGAPRDHAVTDDEELSLDSTGVASLVLLDGRLVDPLTVCCYSAVLCALSVWAKCLRGVCSALRRAGERPVLRVG